MKNSTKIKIKPHEIDTVASNSRNGILSFPINHTGKNNPFSNTRMKGAFGQGGGSPVENAYKVSV